MSFWNKFGKIALQAAPYVAAPFTGGASLLATGATQKLGQKWAEHDANANIAKGLAPSKFDNILGKVSAGAGLASAFIPGGQLGALGKAGSAASKTGGWTSALGNIGKGALGGGSGWQGALGSALGDYAMNSIGGNNEQPQQQQPTRASSASNGLGPSEQAVSRNLNRTPNLEDYLNQGSEEGLYDQPWRKPYPASIYNGIGGNRRFQASYDKGIAPGTY